LAEYEADLIIATNSSKRSFLTTSTATSFLFPSTPTPSARPSPHISAKNFQSVVHREDEADTNLIADFSSPILDRSKDLVAAEDEANKKRKVNPLVLSDEIELMSSPALTDADFEDTVYDHEAELKRNSTIVLEDDGDEDIDLPTLDRDSIVDDAVTPPPPIVREATDLTDLTDDRKSLEPATRNLLLTPPLRNTPLALTQDTASKFKPLPVFAKPAPKQPSFPSATSNTSSISTKPMVSLSTKPTYVLPIPKFPSSSRTTELSRTPLPSMDWSPSHRSRRNKNAKYVAGGLAATTLGWVFDAQDAMMRANNVFSGFGISTQTDKPLREPAITVVVREVRKEESYVAITCVVKGTIGGKFENVGTVLKVFLISDGKNAWAGKVLSKTEVGLGEPISEVELYGEKWKIAINWRVLGT